MQIGKFVLTSRGAGAGLRLTDGPGQQCNPAFCPSLRTAFPLATAQQLLAEILINPIQPRRNLFSNSASLFMK